MFVTSLYICYTFEIAKNKGAVQTARKRSLVCAFVVCARNKIRMRVSIIALFLSVQYIQLREVSDTKKIVPDFFYNF